MIPMTVLDLTTESFCKKLLEGIDSATVSTETTTNVKARHLFHLRSLYQAPGHHEK